MDSCITRAEHEEFTKRMEAEHTRQNRRIELLEENVERQGERLDKLEGKPGDNWNIVVKGLLTAVATAIGGGLVATVAAVLMK